MVSSSSSQQPAELQPATAAAPAQQPIEQQVDIFQHMSNDSVYVQFVKLLSNGASRDQLVAATWGLLIVLLLQLALVVMLSFASVDHNNTALKPDTTGYLQLQMRVLQLQICSLQVGLTRPSNNSSVVDTHTCHKLLALIRDGQNNTSSPPPPWMSTDTMQSAYEGFGVNNNAQGAATFPPAAVFQPPLQVASTGQSVLVLCFAATSLLVLAVFVAVELLEASELAYVVLVLGGRLHRLEVRPHHRDGHLRISTFLRERPVAYYVAPIMPVLQSCVCYGVFAAGILLVVNMKFSTDLVQIIINSVALSFVMDVDNKVGQLLQRQVWQPDQAIVAPYARIWENDGPREVSTTSCGSPKARVATLIFMLTYLFILAVS